MRTAKTDQTGRMMGAQISLLVCHEAAQMLLAAPRLLYSDLRGRARTGRPSVRI